MNNLLDGCICTTHTHRPVGCIYATINLTKGGVVVPKEVKVTFEPRAEANLRKLARALIALAQAAIEKEEAEAARAAEVPRKKAS